MKKSILLFTLLCFGLASAFAQNSSITNLQMEQRLNDRRELIKERYPELFAKMSKQELQMFREQEMRMIQHESKISGAFNPPEGLQDSHKDLDPDLNEPGIPLPGKGGSDYSHVSTNDSVALVALYNATNGPNWYNNSNWLTGPVNTWYGITVSDNIVTVIYLDNNNLTGNIPPEIGNLSNLTSLYLYYNQLIGNIPAEIANLSNLQLLYLSGNQLTGSIPSEIGNLINLQSLDLYSNQLSGNIPTEIGNLVNLESLDLSYNQLSGSLPPEIGNLTNLYDLRVYENQISGSIPPEIGNLTNLYNFNISNNQFSGSIPTEIGNLTILHWINLAGNQLSGNIPPEIGNLANLQNLFLEVNQISGILPSEIGNFTNLQYLSISYNQLTGPIPAEIGNLTNLLMFSLSDNLFTGSIPTEIGNLSNLQNFFLDNNQLTGNIPTEVGNLNNLQNLFLYNNQFNGSIPIEICNIQNLEAFYFNNNNFDLGSCPAIECLTSNGVYMPEGTQLNGLNLLTDCNSPLVVYPSNQEVTAEAGTTSFNVNTNAAWTTESNKPWCTVISNGTGNGTITATYTENTSLGSRIANITVTAIDLSPVVVTITQAGIGNLSTDSLALVALYNATDGPNWYNNSNWLTGPLNTWYGITVNEGFVSEIYLSYNNLTGSIPLEIGNLANLQWLWLHGNQLTGSITQEIGNLTNLQTLYLASNQLTGSIPVEIGNLANLQYLHLYGNQFNGSIPLEIGNLSNLYQLFLNDNQLTGSIPSEIGNLSNLQILFLQNNQFNGSIPWQIGSLTNLQSLWLFNNQFSGNIPVEICNMSFLNDFAFENNYFDLGSCPAIACLQSNGVNMYDGTQLNGLDLLTDCDSPLVVYPANQNVTADAGTTSFNVFSNATWTAESNKPWCAVTPDGEGNGTITATYNENTSLGSRIAIITVTAVDLPPVYVTVTQAGIGNLSTDSLALVALYNATNGPNWTNNTNWLTGPVNTWYGITITNDFVTQIYLTQNNLNGIIPSEIGNLFNLQNLTLFQNQINGIIPPEICNLSNLYSFDLSANQLNGNIPSEIGSLSNLQNLALSDNQLSGNIPPEIGSLSNLQNLALSDNQLSGNILPEIGNLSNLLELTLSNNQLSGNIPPELGNLTNLAYLYLSFNQLTGSIPPEIGNLSSLKALILSQNELSGVLPSEIWNLTNLQYFVINENQLTGSIPPEIGNLSNLLWFMLAFNELSGAIPIEICIIPNLNEFYFWYNYFDLESCPTMACLQSNGVNMYDGTQLNGYNLLTDCDLPSTIEIGIDEDWVCADGSSYYFGNVTAQNYYQIQWSTTGSGYFDDQNLLHPSYFPSNDDYLQGSVTISVIVSGGIGNAEDFMVLHFVSTPEVSAGTDASVNAGESYNLADATATIYNSLLWTTTGDGAFDEPGIVSPVYTPGFADIISGQVELCLSATTQFCLVTDCLTLNILSTAAISVDPISISQELAPNETATQTLVISNNGESPLYWNSEVIDVTALNYSNIGIKSPDSKSKTANMTNQFTVYCDASTTTEDEYIANVLFGSINNSSGWQGGVSDYTEISTSIEAGASETMTVTNPVPYSDDSVYVWVDWNKDFVFGAGEEEYMLTNVDGTGAIFTGSVAVPVGQASDAYRMRIRMTYSTAPEPCGDAQYGEIEDYTIIVGGGLNWLTLSPTSGTVQPGETTIVDVTFDGTSMAKGTYNADITINSNAINEPLVIIPAQLTVSGGVPNISLSVGSLDFGTIQVGGTTTQSVTVSNTGYGLLEITETNFSNPDFSLLTSASAINPGESVPFVVQFAPSVTGLISGIFTISNNDPDQPEVTIDLSGSAYLEVPQNLIANVVGHDVTLTWDQPFKNPSRGLLSYNIYRDGSLIDYSSTTNYTDFNVMAGNHEYQVSAVYDEGESELTPAVSVLVGSPIIEVNPVSFEEYLTIETSITREMMITNSGDLPLTFAVNTGYNRNFKTTNENSSDELGNHEEIKELGKPQIIKLERDNTKPGGPSPYQTDEATIRYDNGVNFDAIGLTSGGTLEVASFFPAATMAQYAGLKLTKLEFYLKDLPNQCIIKIYGPGTGTTPGALLYSEAITAPGLSWNIIDLSIPVDISGQDLWIGYEVTHDENTYPAGHDPGPADAGFDDMIFIEGTWAPLSSYDLNYNWNLAGYLIEPPLDWLIVSPTAGTLLPGESATVDVTFNATYLTPDVYTAKINISSNDPNTPLIEIPVQLTVQTDETHVISINQGWSGISSYLIPTDSDVESLLQPIISDLTILQSGTGIYWPDQNVNTIGSWDTHHGYVIKVANAVDLTITGLRENDRTLYLSEGWNLIPVLSNYEVDVETLFNGTNLVILKEVAGVGIYWPSMNIQSINFVEPGKAYFIKMSSPDSITFPVKSLVVTPQNPEVTAVASELTIAITSNTSWSVIENVAWLSVSPVSGSNDGTITVIYEANSSSESRIGQIIITAAGGAPLVNLTITQAGLPWLCGQTLYDTRDSKTYTTVQIGTQCWMAQNLNIGTMILETNDMADDGTIEKYCYDNTEANCDVYGGLYQWNEMMEYTTTEGIQGICPTGWHLPTDAEWTNLTTILGGESVAGGKMKETGTTHWTAPNTGATNSSGFTGLPAGFRNSPTSSIGGMGYGALLWSSTENLGSYAWFLYLYYNNSNGHRSYSSKFDGFSVRCLKDESTNSTIPTITTSTISNITQITATSGGDVTSDGGAAVTERGICWGTNSNPITTDNHTVDGEGTGVFESNLTDLAANTLYFVRAYATNSVGTAYGEEVSFTTLAGSGSTCGTSIIINHVAGDVAPVYKTVTYGIVTNIPGEPSKCWITSNLGADHQATSVDDATEPSAGWYWQFNRKQGYKHTGSVRTPNTTWISSISENSNWISTNDPCTLELGSGWRIPSYTEWSNVNSFGNWTDWNDPWNSDLKIHAAGYLNDSDGSMPGRGVLGLYWSSAQSGVTYGQFLVFMVGAGNSGMSWDPKARGIPLRCLRD